MNSNLHKKLDEHTLVLLDGRKQESWEARDGKKNARGREGYTDITKRIDRLEGQIDYPCDNEPTHNSRGEIFTSLPEVFSRADEKDSFDSPGMVWCGVDVFEMRVGDAAAAQLADFLKDFAASTSDEVMMCINDGVREGAKDV